MRQLKSIAAVGGAVALIGIWPLAVGQIAQTLLTDAVQNANNSDVSVELVNYDRGYLEATATTRISVVDPQVKIQLKAHGLPDSFELKHQISHGIFSVGGETRLDGYPELMLTTKTQLNGNTEFKSDIPAQQFMLQESDTLKAISVGESHLKGSVSVLGKLDYDLSIARLEVDYSNGTVFAFNGFLGNGTGEFERSMWLGQQTHTLDNFVASDPEHVTTIEVSGAEVENKIHTDKNTQTLQADYHLTLDEFRNVEGEAKNLDVQFTASGFDKEAFLTLYEMLAQQQGEWTNEDVEKAIPHLDTLLQKGLSLSLNKFSLDVDEGHFDSNWEVMLPEDEKHSSKDFLKLLDALQGQVNAFVSNDLVLAYPYIEQNLDDLLVDGIATKSDEGYDVKLKLDKGKVMFTNGKEAPLMTMILPLLMLSGNAQ